jgi:hypothetical protein
MRARLLAALLTGAQAPVAQRIEHLTTDQKVGSSNLSGRARTTPNVHFPLMRLPPVLRTFFNTRRDSWLTSPRKTNIVDRVGAVMNALSSGFECNFCHSFEGDIVCNETFGFVILCGECGYAQQPTLPQLLAS